MHRPVQPTSLWNLHGGIHFSARVYVAAKYFLEKCSNRKSYWKNSLVQYLFATNSGGPMSSVLCMREGRTSSIPLLIDKNGTEHNTAKKTDSLSKFFSNKFSLGSNGLQLPDLPDLQALTHPTLSNVHFRAPFCSATSLQAFSIQGHWPRRYPCYGPERMLN